MKATFLRKPTYEELIPQEDFKVENVVMLTEAEFQAFIHHPLNDYDFIIENNHLIGFDKAGVRHCILVKGETSDFGILVDSEGSSYARYAACIPLSNLSLK